MPPGGIYRAGQAIVPGWRGYRRRGRKKGRRQKKKEKREKKGKLKEGNYRACAKAGPEHTNNIFGQTNVHHEYSTQNLFSSQNGHIMMFHEHC